MDEKDLPILERTPSSFFETLGNIVDTVTKIPEGLINAGIELNNEAIRLANKLKAQTTPIIKTTEGNLTNTAISSAGVGVFNFINANKITIVSVISLIVLGFVFLQRK